MIEEKILRGRCQELLKTYGDILELVLDEVRTQMDGDLNGSVEEIALQYTRRQGIKEGAKLFLSKISAKASNPKGE